VERRVVLRRRVRRHGADPRQVSAALGAGPADGVAHAAVRQPPGGAAVQAGLPRQVQLPRRRQPAAQRHAAV